MFEVSEYGALVISDELAAHICKKLGIEDPGEDYELYDTTSNLMNIVPGFCHAPGFDGKATKYMNRNDEKWFENDYVMYIAAEKDPSLFSAVYANFTDLVREYEEKLEIIDVGDARELIANNICDLFGTFTD